MAKSTVYFTNELTPEAVVKMYRQLGIELPGRVAVKVHSGEDGNQNYLHPEFMKPVIYAVNGTVFALELLALMLAACMSFSLQFYAALAAGHSFANHKMALSVAFFFVFQFVVQMAGAIVLVLLDEGPLHQFLLTLDFQLTGVAAVHFTMVALLLLTVLYGAIFYIVTTITLKKRLNLE